MFILTSLAIKGPQITYAKLKEIINWYSPEDKEDIAGKVKEGHTVGFTSDSEFPRPLKYEMFLTKFPEWYPYSNDYKNRFLVIRQEDKVDDSKSIFKFESDDRSSSLACTIPVIAPHEIIKYRERVVVLGNKEAEALPVSLSMQDIEGTPLETPSNARTCNVTLRHYYGLLTVLDQLSKSLNQQKMNLLI